MNLTRAPFLLSTIVFYLCCQLSPHGALYAEPPTAAIEGLVKSASAIRSIAAVSFDADYVAHRSGGKFFGRMHLERIGNATYAKYRECKADSWQEANETLQQREKTLEALGGDIPTISSFDGKRLHSFTPDRLDLMISPAPEFTVIPPLNKLSPAFWTSFQSPATQFDKVFTIFNDFDVREVQLGNGIVELFANTQNTSLALSTYQIRLNPTRGFLPESYSASGKMATMSATMEWKEAIGNWYPFKVALKFGPEGRAVPILDWEITSISFDAKRIRKNFAVGDSDVPFGTHVRILSSKDGDPQRDYYVGGREGQIENELRSTARSLNRD